MKIIPIVFICDDNYAMPTAVAITSIKENMRKNYLYRIFVLSVGLTDINIRKIRELNDNLNFVLAVLAA